MGESTEHAVFSLRLQGIGELKLSPTPTWDPIQHPCLSLGSPPGLPLHWHFGSAFSGLLNLDLPMLKTSQKSVRSMLEPLMEHGTQDSQARSAGAGSLRAFQWGTQTGSRSPRQIRPLSISSLGQTETLKAVPSSQASSLTKATPI